jgi:hypothetical protein
MMVVEEADAATMAVEEAAAAVRCRDCCQSVEGFQNSQPEEEIWKDE